MERLRRRVYEGGVEGSLRKEVWKWLLGMYKVGSTAAERLKEKEELVL